MYIVITHWLFGFITS